MRVIKGKIKWVSVPGGIAVPPSPRGYKYGTWSSMLGMGLTNPPCKKLPVRKPEMWPRIYGLEELYYGGKGPHWAVALMKKKKIHFPPPTPTSPLHNSNY